MAHSLTLMAQPWSRRATTRPCSAGESFVQARRAVPLAMAPPLPRGRPPAAVPSLLQLLPRSAPLAAARPAAPHRRPSRPAPPRAAAGDGGDSGTTPPGGGGSGGGGGDEDDDDELLSLAQAQELAAAKGASLPEDFAAAAASGGLRRSALAAYLALVTGGGWLTAAVARGIPIFRDRLLADKLFLFKVMAEVAIDSACATVAEVRKRGSDFWGEFEFYLSDLMVGLVLDVVLVTLIAPVAVTGAKPRSASKTGVRRWVAQLPSAVFEKSGPLRKYSLGDRAACYVARGLEYSLAGLACGLVGQGVANGLMHLRRQTGGTSEHDVAVPPLLGTAAVWGLFMGVSSNTRYQIVFGLERLVDETIARRVPKVAYGTSVVIRFVNNVIGGEQFIDMARWAGVQ